MEINANSMAAREMALNKAFTNHDILMKTQEKSNEFKESQPAVQGEAPEVGKKIVQGRIDVYA